jgi:hypothetical protein
MTDSFRKTASGTIFDFGSSVGNFLSRLKWKGIREAVERNREKEV